MLWRRRARKQRAKQTAVFAQTKNLPHHGDWRWRLARFGERLFGGQRPRRGLDPESEEIKLMRLREAEEARHYNDTEKIIDSYGDSSSGMAGGSSSDLRKNANRRRSHLAANSIYSEVTGVPRRTPETRQPVKDYASTRLSSSTFGSYMYRSGPPRAEQESTIPPVPTEAQTYANAIRPALAASPPVSQGMYWMEPVKTGSSNNPFRK
ncbi:hypothetical protein ONZ45_g14892 [Pleurotus djamor]|nr:hypothetical protein ONZ45_g14892 [Pleurotus djamor]